METYNFIVATLLLCGVIYFLKVYLRFRRLKAVIDKIPGYETKFPFGTFHRFFPRTKWIGNHVQAMREFKTIYRSWFGPFIPFVHVVSGKYTRQLFQSSVPYKGEQFAHAFSGWMGSSVLTSNGAEWHMKRKLISPAFHFGILKGYCSIFTEKTHVLIQKLNKIADNGEAVDIFPQIEKLSLDIAGKCVFGYEINSLSQDHSPYAEAFGILCAGFFKRCQPPFNFNPIFFATAAGRNFKKSAEVVHKLVDEIIYARKKLGHVNSIPSSDGAEEQQDFLDMLLQAEDENGQPLPDKTIRDEVNTFLATGSETTATAISWAIYLISKYPEVERKIVEELKEVLGENREEVPHDDLCKLTYLNMVIKECLRMRPAVPIILRTMTEDTEIAGYIIPKGIIVHVWIISSHYNPEDWDEPEKFIPERFADNANINPFSYVPFSAGPRNCIGQQFALNEMKIVLSMLYQRFTFKLVKPEEEVTPIPAITMKPLQGINVYMTHRK